MATGSRSTVTSMPVSFMRLRRFDSTGPSPPTRAAGMQHPATTPECDEPDGVLLLLPLFLFLGDFLVGDLLLCDSRVYRLLLRRRRLRLWE